jgi:hypothetical protein
MSLIDTGLKLVGGAVRAESAAARVLPGIADEVAAGAAKVATGFEPAAVVAAPKTMWEELQALAATQARPEHTAPSGMIKGVKEIARKVEETPRRVNDAIHWIKNEGKIGGAEKNPDVFFDPASGELYPMLRKTGKAGPDSFGNLHEALRLMPERYQH